MEQNLNPSIFEQMIQEYQKLKEENIREEQEAQEVKNQILNFDISKLSESDRNFVDRLADTFINGIDSELTPEQRGQLDRMTGRERIGATAMIWGAINAASVGVNALRLQDSVNIRGIITKILGDTSNILTYGNVIYKALQDFKDGASATEVFNFVKDSTATVISGSKIIYTLYQIMESPDIPGESFLQRMLNYYTDTKTVNVNRVGALADALDVYNFNFDTHGFGVQRYTGPFHQIDDVVATRPMSNIFDKNDIPQDGIQGIYRNLDNVDPDFTTHPLSYEAPETTFSKVRGTADRIYGVAGLITDTATLSKSIADLAIALENGESVTPTQIISIISAAMGTVGDALNFGGPIAAIVGTVISGAGALVAACNGFANLNSDSTPKQIGFAVSDFVTSLIPLAPSARMIEQAIKYQDLYEHATNPVDKEIYNALHTIASIDATPVANWFNSVYAQEIKEGVRNELMNRFSTFNNMMSDYITNDADFNNQLNRVATFLKQNENTDYTQYITAYLTPEQVKTVFGDIAEYRSGYDIRNVNLNLGVINKYPGRNKNSLINTSGLSILDIGDRLRLQDGRDVLDTISLGYGIGKTTNGRRVDTSTCVSYTKEALDSIREDLRNDHINYVVPSALEVIARGYNPLAALGLVHAGAAVEDPNWRNPRVWLDLVDNVSGAVVENINPIKQNELVAQNADTIERLNASEGIKIGNMNNRVRAVATDVIFPNVVTGLGDDDAIFTGIVRSYSGADSIVRAVADGGEGDDILDLSHMMDSKYDNEVFNWQYSLDNNLLNLSRRKNDGLDLELGFKDFETIILGNGINNIKLEDGVATSSVQEFKISSTVGKENNIDLSGVKSRNLVFNGDTKSRNNINGSLNNDIININDNNESQRTQNLFGNEGNDFIKGGNVRYNSENNIDGGSGNDVLIGNGLTNRINGGTGNDFIIGSSSGGHEELYGGDGNDIIQESTPTDIVKSGIYNGGNGNDTIKITNANSHSYITVDGGEGVDTLDLSKLDMPYSSWMGSVNLQTDKFTYNEKIMSLSNIENIIGSNANLDLELLTGNDKNNVIRGGAGKDLISGVDGNDILYGDDGDDTLVGGNGYNVLYGGKGNDKFSIEHSIGIDRIMDFDKNDTLKLDTSNINEVIFERHRYQDATTRQVVDSLFIKDGERTTELYNSFNSGIKTNEIKIEGSNFSVFDTNMISQKIIQAVPPNEIVVGSDLYNELHGYDSYNLIKGGEGDDSLNSTNGNDIIIAGAGNDDIVGYDGNKIVYLGSGSDNFNLLDDVSANTKIMDFNKEDNLVIYANKFNSLDGYDFERRKYTDIATKEAIDSLCIKTNNSYVELYNWYNKGLDTSELNIFDGNSNQNLDKNLVAQKIQHAANIAGEIQPIVNAGAAPAPAPMVDYNNINYSGLSSFSSNLGTVNF